MSNPMLDKLRSMQQNPSADDATEPEAKPTESSAEPATEPDAPAESAKKRPSVLERMKAGKTGKDKSSASTSPKAETTPPTESSGAAINPPPKKGARAKPATDKGKSPDDSGTATSSTSAKPAGAAAQFRKAKKATKTDKTTLLIGCYPVQGAPAPLQLHELLADVKQAVCEANGVAHWGLIEFGKGDAALAQALDEKLKEEGAPLTLYAELFSAESRAVEEVLLSHYDVVVRGLR